MNDAEELAEYRRIVRDLEHRFKSQQLQIIDLSEQAARWQRIAERRAQQVRRLERMLCGCRRLQ